MVKCFLSAILFAEILCGSWNLKWFPSGRAEHRASARVERANTADAADVIRDGVAVAGEGTGVILFLQELRDEQACSNLVAVVGVPGLSVASVSAFRERDRRLGWQQTAIASTLPVVDASWSYWKRPKGVFPPRGYAYALLDGGKDGLIACYCVHLKSNYGATTEEKKADNRRKRETCARQLAALAAKAAAPDGRKADRIVIAGDFNCDAFDAKRLADEKTFCIIADAGFKNAWEGEPLEKRATYPSRSARWSDSTLDYIFWRGFSGRVSAGLSPEVPLSDHRMAWLRVR